MSQDLPAQMVSGSSQNSLASQSGNGSVSQSSVRLLPLAGNRPVSGLAARIMTVVQKRQLVANFVVDPRLGLILFCLAINNFRK